MTEIHTNSSERGRTLLLSVGIEGNSKIQITFVSNYFLSFSGLINPPSLNYQNSLSTYPSHHNVSSFLTQRLAPFLSPKHSWEKRLVFGDQGTYWPRGDWKQIACPPRWALLPWTLGDEFFWALYTIFGHRKGWRFACHADAATGPGRGDPHRSKLNSSVESPR